MSPNEPDIDSQTIANAVQVARAHPPYTADPQFAAVQEAEIGAPRLVYTPQGEPSFWLTPLLAGNWACGFAFADLHGRVTRLGIFGGTPRDRAAWVRADFFKKPPAPSLAEIAARYPGVELSPPLFSYDRNPVKWAWVITTVQGDTPPTHFYITPGGWYERPEASSGDREG